MSLRSSLNEALKEAMKARDSARLSTLRLINAAIKDRDIAARGEGRAEGRSEEGVADTELLALLGKLVKQRQESARIYEEGGRLELAEKELAEVRVITEFLPRQMSEEEAAAVIDETIAALGANSIRDMGRVMAELKAKYTGQMDFAVIGAKIREKLA
ncbi:GatB/YqeY domain-containing protein [Xinfangfangia sp. D13-10-4-6]|uniref:GatB/YqeY domain-containing protein n=1 Tax=Pseudogemmobacter hezensis TaxID=2737662 RepID=UPI00155459BB|nr:GatB/YqeY domain-containing protein [Pseudogemmobacter hezensis]NPD16242.1 GatB/YqeY domain-containing protein [Pseudogemmobacter hezensis]